MSALPQLLVSGLVLGGVYALVAIGLTLVFGVARVVNFAHGELLMVGMYLTYLLYVWFGFSPYAALFIGVPVMFFVGWVIERALIARTIGRPPVVAIFATVGLGQILSNGALAIFKANFLQVPTSFSARAISVMGIYIGLPQLLAFVVGMMVSLVLYVWLEHSFFGKAIRATAQDRGAAQMVGIDIRRVYTIVFAVGAALVGVAGALLIPIYPVHPTVGVNFVLIAFVVVVMGGLGSVPGAVLAGLIVAIIESITSYYIDPGWKQAVYFILFIALLVVRPQGIFGRVGAEEL